MGLGKLFQIDSPRDNSTEVPRRHHEQKATVPERRDSPEHAERKQQEKSSSESVRETFVRTCGGAHGWWDKSLAARGHFSPRRRGGTEIVQTRIFFVLSPRFAALQPTAVWSRSDRPLTQSLSRFAGLGNGLGYFLLRLTALPRREG